MRLVIRADASRTIGTGHVTRSCVIAESAISRGVECLFVGDLGGIQWLENMVADIGFSEIINAEGLPKFSNETDLLILDTYSPTDAWILNLPWRGTIAIVDPFTPDFPVDIRLHPGLESDWSPDSKSVFLGDGRYLLVRSAFRKEMPAPKRSSSFPEILVLGGGTDPFAFCETFAPELQNIPGDFHVNLISDSIKVPLNDFRFTVYPPGDIFTKLVAISDLVFSPASTSALEVLAHGLPLGVVCATENQETNYQTITSKGLACGVGYRERSGHWKFNHENIELLLSSDSFREKIAMKNRQICDLQGSHRALDFILHFYQRT